MICSRYAFSGVAYTVAKKKMGIQEAAEPDRGILVPDFTLFLHADAETLENRYNAQDRYENLTFQQTVLQSFREVQKLPHTGPWVDVEVKGTIEETSQTIWHRVKPLLERAPAWKDGLFE